MFTHSIDKKLANKSLSKSREENEVEICPREQRKIYNRHKIIEDNFYNKDYSQNYGSKSTNKSSYFYTPVRLKNEKNKFEKYYV